VHAREHASERGVIAGRSHLYVLEHKIGFVARFAAAQWSRNPGAGGSERCQAVSFGDEVVELVELVDFRKVSAALALEDEAAVDATSAAGHCALDAKPAGGFREGGLQGGEKLRGDQARLSAARARLIAARTLDGAVPPLCERLATEPSRVSTR
jgi:hypothetical protein